MNFYYLDCYIENLIHYEPHAIKLDKLIVVASNLGQAEVKIDRLIAKLNEKYQPGKVRPVGHVQKIDGFMVSHDFFGKTDIVCLGQNE